MLRRMPSLGALRAFEAAMRCKGLAGAADELSVTPSAISHQIRQLERELGLKLVRREGRRLALTEAGAHLIPGLEDAFERISTTVAFLKERDTSAPLTISMLPNFAINWFLPRLHHFQQLYPDIKVELSLTQRFVDFAREEIDMAVRLAASPPPDLHASVLFRDELTPACSPQYLKIHGPFWSPHDLIGHQLLISDGRPADAWRAWFEKAGVAVDLPPDSLHFESSQFALQAAANGVGFAICGMRLLEPMLKRGALVAPFQTTVPEHGTFYVVTPEAWATRPKIRLMRAWLTQLASSATLT